MNKLTGFLVWLDKNILKIMTLIYIYFMPLWPKFPMHMFRDTFIALRFEDIFMLAFVLIFFYQVAMQKVVVKTPFFILFILFWLTTFISFAWGYYVQESFIFQYLGFLHAARRVEYMIVFFIAATIVTSKRDLVFYLQHIMFAALLVFLYGIGQKFIGLPAIQTMNAEFAKGTPLFLTADARISSTFAGHYDLAAYTVLLIPVFIGLYIYKRQIWMMLTSVIGISILVLTASRSSYVAYLLSTFPYIVFRRRWIILGVIVASTIGLTLASDTVTQRFADTFRVRQVFVNEETGQVILPQNISTSELPAGTAFVQTGTEEISDDERAESEELLREQYRRAIQTEAKRTGQTLTPEEEDALIAQQIAGFKPIVAYASDISFATRLEVEWPRAIDSLKSNILLGTGPSSITEATDNSYFRWLGEFGILGAGFFFAILFSIAWRIIDAFKHMTRQEIGLYSGFLFGTFGLMINATYIDVFEASKVAFTFWLVAGLFIGTIPHFTKKAHHHHK